MNNSLIARLRRFAGRTVPVAPRAKVRALQRSRTQARRHVAQLNSELDQLRATMARQRMHVEFVDRLAAGYSLEEAVISLVREMISAGETDAATSLAFSLAGRPGSAQAGRLATGVVAIARKLPELAHAEFQQVQPNLVHNFAPAEYLESVYRCTPATLRDALYVVLENHHTSRDPGTLSQIVRYAYVVREYDIAKRAYGHLRELASESADVATEVEWLQPWLDTPAGDAGPSHDHVRFALLDYRQPGRAKTSQNIGDHIQTLASLGHLVRHQNIRFHGDPALVEFVRDMQERVRPDRLERTTAERDVSLTVISRDASSYQPIPEGTWTFAFGWYMHPVFGIRHDFPLHPNLQPIFVSFHCNKREMLTPEAVEYLRRHGPVGCRDWTTVDLLLSIGVPAFFSGCITTTVDTLFPGPRHAEPATESATVYVDMPREMVPHGAATVRHSNRRVKQRGFARNMSDSVRLLEKYMREFDEIVTSRLHCYLPARSLGLRVDFRPKNRTDIRFNGLIDIDDAGFDTMRSKMLSRIETVVTAILDGKSADQVYEVWGSTCADDVAAARSRHTTTPDPVAPSAPRGNATEPASSAHEEPAHESADHTPTSDLVVVADAADIARLKPTLNSLSAHASRTVRLWLLGDWAQAQLNELNEPYPAMEINRLPRARVPGATKFLLLPNLLPSLRRATVIPAGSVVLADVAELSGIALNGQPFAAATTPGLAGRSGFGVIYRAARRLHPDAASAHELYRLAHARHAFDFDAFDTDVLVLDLDRLRRDRFADTFMPYRDRFGFRAGELLHFYAGPSRAVLPAEWAHVPTREHCDSPKLINWPERAKPWHQPYVPRREVWQRAQQD